MAIRQSVSAILKVLQPLCSQFSRHEFMEPHLQARYHMSLDACAVLCVLDVHTLQYVISEVRVQLSWRRQQREQEAHWCCGWPGVLVVQLRR